MPRIAKVSRTVSGLDEELRASLVVSLAHWARRPGTEATCPSCEVSLHRQPTGSFTPRGSNGTP